MLNEQKSLSLEDYYSRRAAEYEQIYERPERQEELAVLIEKTRTAFKDLDVLEIACGTGYWTQFISHEVRSILATDCSEEVIGFAKEKEYPLGNASFLVDDAYSLSKISGEFNGGFCGFWWSHIPKARLSHFLDVFHSKLTTGTTILMIDNQYVKGNSTPITHIDDDGNSYQMRRLSDGSSYEVLKNFPSEKELLNAIGQFTSHIDFFTYTYYWLIQYKLT
jgi:demethylmenaquinone methyltransferase/2-methoxy-6-polyprenyl-1,4-benzoquinol methylase